MLHETPIDFAQLLNDEQLHAVNYMDGPLLVLAGAGSGKTRVITYKIAHLVQQCGLKPWQILAVTFTNKAAGEMRERVERILGPDAREVWLGTFHSICLKVLRRHTDLTDRGNNFVIYDDDDRKRLIKRVLKSLNIAADVITVQQAAAYIDRQQHALRGPTHPQLPVETFRDRYGAKVFKSYEAAKRLANAFDFGDLIGRTVAMFEKHPALVSEYQFRWQYILVDEFQDTDHAQYRLIKMLAGDRAKLCVVGDDDQSIYRWRGAEVANILGFPKDFGDHNVKTVRLERNYRSTANILKAASGLISHNQERHDKALWTDREPGDKIQCYRADSELAEARWAVRQALAIHREGVPLRDIAIFYRTHAQSRQFEDALRADATPYIVVGGLKFYERKEVKDILAYMRLVHNPSDDVALMRIINEPPRGIGATTMDRARKQADADGASLFEGLVRLANLPEGKRARKSIERFSSMVATLRNISNDEADSFRVAEAVLKETGYIDRLRGEGTFEAESRRENVEELMVSIENWRGEAEERGLAPFLDHVSLLTSLDLAKETADAMVLMTVHAAKGLEFDSVFVTGLEENVFPHFNAKEDEDIEEERRLAYVAITRAQRRAFVTWARSRQRFGRVDINPPSRFIREIPQDARTGDSDDPFSSYASGKKPAFGGTDLFSSRSRKSTVRQDKRTGNMLDFGDSQVPDSEVDGLGIGANVNHPSFGVGRVARIDGSGPTARVTVQFPAFGTKKIVAKFLDFGAD